MAVSAVITGMPMIHQPEDDPFNYVKDGDMVTVNGDEVFFKIEGSDAVQKRKRNKS